LLEAGCKRPVFIGRLESAPSCIARSAGFRDAAQEAGLPWSPTLIRHVDPTQASQIHQVIKDASPDGIVCSNDFTAAHFMRALEDLSLDVPSDVGVVGFDDVKYASLLPVPLTTIHQPCAELGATAVRVMIERLRNPHMPARDVLLNFTLIVRASSGGAVTTSQTEHAETVHA
jgi:GntR family transcriptional regulator, arabinose operon transcriptional repressor